MKKIGIALAALLVVVIVIINLPASITGIRGAGDLPRISYTETFEQAHAEYFVYFWDAACPACQALDPYIVTAHENGANIYVIDVSRNPDRDVFFRDTNFQPWTAEEIGITYTPTMMRLMNGQVVGFAEGLFEARDMLAPYLSE